MGLNDVDAFVYDRPNRKRLYMRIGSYQFGYKRFTKCNSGNKRRFPVGFTGYTDLVCAHDKCNERVRLVHFDDESYKVQFPSKEGCIHDHEPNWEETKEVEIDFLVRVATKLLRGEYSKMYAAYRATVQEYAGDAAIIRDYDRIKCEIRRMMRRLSEKGKKEKITSLEQIASLAKKDERFMNRTALMWHEADELIKLNADTEAINELGDEIRVGTKEMISAEMRRTDEEMAKLRTKREILQALYAAKSGELVPPDFMLKGITKDKSMIFTTKWLAKQLADAECLAIDATFRTTPLLPGKIINGEVKADPVEFEQLLTIHAIRFLANEKGEKYPQPALVCVALMTGRNETNYDQVFSYVRRYLKKHGIAEELKAKRVVRDFEYGLRNSIDRVLLGNGIKSTGCFFHFTQAVTRKMNELGGAILRTDSEFYSLWRELLATALLPEDFKPAACFICLVKMMQFVFRPVNTRRLIALYQKSNSMLKNMNSDMGKAIRKVVLKFVAYFVKSWCGARPLHRLHEWDFWQAELRTNNCVESWNKKWNSLCKTHGCFTDFLESLRREFFDTACKITRVNAKPTYRTKEQREREAKIQACIKAFEPIARAKDYRSALGTWHITGFLHGVCKATRPKKYRHIPWYGDCNICMSLAKPDVFWSCSNVMCQLPHAHMSCVLKEGYKWDGVWFCRHCKKKMREEKNKESEAKEGADVSQEVDIACDSGMRIVKAAKRSMKKRTLSEMQSG